MPPSHMPQAACNICYSHMARLNLKTYDALGAANCVMQLRCISSTRRTCTRPQLPQLTICSKLPEGYCLTKLVRALQMTLYQTEAILGKILVSKTC